MDALTGNQTAAEGGGAAVKQLSTDSKNFVGIMGDTAGKTMDATTMFAAMQGEIVNLGNGFSSVNGIIMKTTPEMEKAGTAVGTFSGALERQQQGLQSIIPLAAEYTNAQGTWSDATKAANDEIDRQSEKVGALQTETSEATQAYLEATRGRGRIWQISSSSGRRNGEYDNSTPRL